MATLPTIDELSPALVTQLHVELATVLQERYPELDLSADGALDGLVTHLSAVTNALQQTANEQQLAARSLFLETADPDSVDPELVDLILSNFRITRRGGNPSRGEVLIVVNQNSTVVIPTGATFSAGSLTYVTEAEYVARPTEATLLTARDRNLRPYPGGQYAFQVPVVATVGGAGGNIKRATRITMSRPPGTVVLTQAAIDFTGGRSEETNSETVQRLETGIAARGWGGRPNIRALLTDQEEFGIQAMTIVGMSEPEQLRDRHGIVAIGSGGKLDIYVKTAARPTSRVIEKTATCVEVTLTGTVWQLVLNPDEAPGFYSIDEIADTTTGALGTVLQDSRFLGATDFDRNCDIANAVEVAYTAFQAASIRFENTISTTVGTQRTFRVTVALMENLDLIQSFCSGYDTGPPACDVLVRAAVPCEVIVGMKVYAPVGAVVDTDSIGDAVAAYINGTGFIGQLSVADIAAAAKNTLPSDHQIGEITLVGNIRAPDGSTVGVASSDVLRLPNSPDLLITERTVTFISDPTAISVDVITFRTP